MSHQQRGRGRGQPTRKVSVTGPNEGPTGEVAAKKDSSLANVLDVLNNRGAGASRPARSEAWDAKEKVNYLLKSFPVNNKYTPGGCFIWSWNARITIKYRRSC